MNLRPTQFDGFIGQNQVVDCLKVLVDASKKDGEALPHTMFLGPPGLGKTTLANIMAAEMGVNIQVANGGSARTVKTLMPYLAKLTDKSILFIDEIHRIMISTSEFLYPAMEDFRVDLGKEEGAVTLNLPKFTLIGATTEGGRLPTPLRDRFQQKFHLEAYDVPPLGKLVQQNGKKIGLDISENCAIMIAERARGTPRVANSLLLWCKKYGVSHDTSRIDSQLIANAMSMIEVDSQGLDKHDRKYLATLRDFGQPVGIKTLTSAMNMSRETIEETIEPFLIRLGLVAKTTRGRILV